MPPWCAAWPATQRAWPVRGMVIMLRSLSLKIYGEGVTEALDAQALWDCDLDGLTGPWVTESSGSEHL